MTSSSKIVKNTTYLSLAYIGQKILSFGYFTLIARFAGVTDTGTYVFALSYTTIFSVFVDFGLSQFIQREVAQNPKSTEESINRVLGLKLFYGVLTAIVSMIGIFFLVQDTLTISMVFVAVLIMLADSYNLTLWSAFRGQHRLSYESISVVISQAIILIVGLSGLFLDASLLVLIFALLAGSLFTSVYATVLVKRKLGFFPRPVGLSWQMAKVAMPFGLAATFTRVFSSLDSVLLRRLVDQAAVGFYSVPNKLVFAAQFIPAAFAASIYPAMSHYYKENRKQMILIFEQSMLFLLMLSVPAAFGIFVLAPLMIVDVFSSAYAPSVLATQVLVWGIIFGFIEYPIGSLLAAIGQQNKNTITRATVMVLNIILNIILIPLYSYLGAAIAAVVSYAVLAFMGFFWLYRLDVKIHWSWFAGIFVRILLSAIIMGLLVYYLIPYVHYAFLILLGVIVYAILVFVLGVISIKEIKQLVRLARGKE